MLSKPLPQAEYNKWNQRRIEKTMPSSFNTVIDVAATYGAKKSKTLLDY